MKNKKLYLFYAGAIAMTMLLLCVSLGVGTSGSIKEENRNVGCNRIYDISRNGIISLHDVEMTWRYITMGDEYHCWEGDLLFDVNCDGLVNFQDCGLIWVHREID